MVLIGPGCTLLMCQAKPAINPLFYENVRWGQIPCGLYNLAASMLPCVVCHAVTRGILSHQSLCSRQHPDNATAHLPP